jgi:hypothetical protein
MTIPFDKLRLYIVKKWTADGNSGAWLPEHEPDPLKNLTETENLNLADIVTSAFRFEIKGFQSKQMIMFDVDIPMQVIESSTPGHYHVYFPNSYIPKEKLFNLLDAMAECGIVERGYAEASRARGFAALRLPWVHRDRGRRH